MTVHHIYGLIQVVLSDIEVIFRGKNVKICQNVSLAKKLEC